MGYFGIFKQFWPGLHISFLDYLGGSTVTMWLPSLTNNHVVLPSVVVGLNLTHDKELEIVTV